MTEKTPVEVIIARSKVRTAKPKSAKKRKLPLRKKKQPAKIVIDAGQGLVFDSEKDLYAYFQTQIEKLESEYRAKVAEDDIKDEEVPDLEAILDATLDQPAEIWHDNQSFKDFPVFNFIRPVEELEAFHVAVTYVSSDDEPSFIFLHFVTRKIDLVEVYRRGDLVFDRAFEEIEFGAIEGDALSEGDPLAMGLFIAMLKLRQEKDLAFDKFRQTGEECREDTIESADEIWRSTDMSGNHIVTFIKEFPDSDIKNLYYLAVTQEDPASHVHTLLFSFPTTDDSLVDRYRHGENLQAEEVTQESSH